MLIGVGAVLLTWILNGETSPLKDFFSAHDSLPDFWLALNVFPFVVGGVISGNHGGGPEALFVILQFIQWFVIGFLLSKLFWELSKELNVAASRTSHV